jgi:hypothetical protein
MREFVFLIAFTLTAMSYFSQQIGDTVVVKAFKYGSNSRDTVIQFPSSNLTYEKIIMRYNMRCKNGLVSTQSQRNLGCGEWDYSCNTYLVDSSRIDQVTRTHPNYIISNFTGSTFPYVNQAPYDYYNFQQTQVLHSVNSETAFPLGNATTTLSTFIDPTQKSGRSQFLLTAAELTTAGYSAGNIDGILLQVASGNGVARFLRVNLRHVTNSFLSANSTVTSSFTNVYNNSYAFTAGANRIQFHTPFVWNGTNDVLFDFSFTNSTPSSALVFSGITTPSVSMLHSNNNYALDFTNEGHAIINTALMSSISSEITISFWAFGNASMMPRNTSVLYATPTNTAQRSLNIHLPWSDGTIYFDCGNNSNGTFDRLQKAATALQQGGQWQHWTFAKNTSTGDMRIYLNGAPWAFTSNKPYAIQLVNLILGKDNALQNNYKGRINELCIWNVELQQADIQNWFKRPIDNTHPLYSNLVAYYKLDEGNGTVINDSKNSLTSNCFNTAWTFDRGHTLTRMFRETFARPAVTLLRGSYSITSNTITVKDSLPRLANTIRQYSITSNATVTPILNDVVVLSNTFQAWQALSATYNGDTGVLTSSQAINPINTLNISNLNYINRSPFYSELLSFVTPYGIGLDFGMNGKTWYYDVSDLAPLLKNKKRFLMAHGGEYQEQMNIDFLFIVGTPPRTVVDFNQLWQSAAGAGDAGIQQIVNDTRFTNLNVALPSNAQAFKVRSSITGHGSEGEFGQNGGNLSHFFNINGGASEFSWKITQHCGFNPVYPQGGTWIYERQGWCPGQASLLKESNITPFVTPGTTVNLDYSIAPPQVPTGDYRYLVSHQLVSYGGPNHSLDANLLDVKMPGNKVIHSRVNPMCANPVVLVQNTGSTPITTLQIDYWLNTTTTKQTYTWSGNLSFLDTTSIRLPIANLWKHGIQPANNVFHAELKTANGLNDQYVHNNMFHSPFTLAEVITSTLTVEFKTNNFANENSYRIVDENGNTVGSSSASLTANTTYTNTYALNGCYKLIVTDSGDDGLQWWANSSQGAGFIRFKDHAGTIIKTFNPDFGSGFEFSFTTPSVQSLTENEWESRVQVYPNPAQRYFTISGITNQEAEIKLLDVLGREVPITVKQSSSKLDVNFEQLKSGVYTIQMNVDGVMVSKKIVIQ